MPHFKSRLESDFYDRFSLPYETDKFEFIIPRHYTPDWTLVPGKVFLETKGHFLAADRTKTLAVLEQHPDIVLIFIFQRPANKLSKKSKTTYWQWCEKYGLEWYDAADTKGINRMIDRVRKQYEEQTELAVA
jgi:hypothetical protein